MTVGLAVTGGRRFPLEGHTHMLPKAVILQDNKKGKKTTFPAGGGESKGIWVFSNSSETLAKSDLQCPDDNTRHTSNHNHPFWCGQAPLFLSIW